MSGVSLLGRGEMTGFRLEMCNGALFYSLAKYEIKHAKILVLIVKLVCFILYLIYNRGNQLL